MPNRILKYILFFFVFSMASGVGHCHAHFDAARISICLLLFCFFMNEENNNNNKKFNRKIFVGAKGEMCFSFLSNAYLLWVWLMAS